MKVLIIGSNGQLGSDLCRVFTKETVFRVIPLTHEQIEIKDRISVEDNLDRYDPDVILNTAAFHQTDRCEDEIANAFAVNAEAVKNLAMTAARRNSILAHYSTDYVFDGKTKTPYTEQACTAPLSMYGISKLAGEYAIQYTLERHFIFRVSGLYGVAGNRQKGYNFVDLMLRRAQDGKELNVVDDQILTPTYTLDVAEKTSEIVKSGRSGLYHLTNVGQCSWFDFTAEIVEQCGIQHVRLNPVKTGFFGEKAKRPAYSVLDNQRLRKEGFSEMPSWQDALKRYLHEKGHLKD